MAKVKIVTEAPPIVKVTYTIVIVIVTRSVSNCSLVILDVMEEDNRNRYADDWSLRLDKYIQELTSEQMKKVVRYAVDWNTNSRYAYVAQVFISSLFRVVKVKNLLDIDTVVESVNSFIAYSERHYQRLDRLHQEVYLLDYITSYAGLQTVNSNSNSDSKSQSNSDNQRSSDSKTKINTSVVPKLLQQKNSTPAVHNTIPVIFNTSDAMMVSDNDTDSDSGEDEILPKNLQEKFTANAEGTNYSTDPEHDSEIDTKKTMAIGNKGSTATKVTEKQVINSNSNSNSEIRTKKKRKATESPTVTESPKGKGKAVTAEKKVKKVRKNSL